MRDGAFWAMTIPTRPKLPTISGLFRLFRASATRPSVAWNSHSRTNRKPKCGRAWKRTPIFILSTMMRDLQSWL